MSKTALPGYIPRWASLIGRVKQVRQAARRAGCRLVLETKWEVSSQDLVRVDI